MTEWEWHFQKLQHGLTLEENNPDFTESSEENNHTKRLPKDDAGLSQNKSHDKHDMTKPGRWTLRAKRFPIKQLIQKHKTTKNVRACASAAGDIFGIQTTIMLKT